jgi:hypothetical protein
MSLDNLKIQDQNLVRTGYQVKYNELVNKVIYDVNLDLSVAGQATLTFITNVDDIVVTIPITSSVDASDVTYQHPDYPDVEQALDFLLYQAPTVSFSSNKTMGIHEVGSTSVFPFTLTSTGVKKSKNLANVKITFSNFSQTFTATPSPATQTPLVTTFISSDWNTNNPTQQIVSTSPSTYTWSSSVTDTRTPTPNIINGGNISLIFTYPLFEGSSTTDFSTYFNSSGVVTNQSAANSLITSFTKTVVTEPSERTVAHTNNQYTYFAFPASYGALNNIFDGTTGFSYSYDTHGAPSVKEWRQYSISLTTSNWTSVPYFVYVSKVVKPTLSIRYKF